MNQYILLVMKWIKSPNTITREELKANLDKFNLEYSNVDIEHNSIIKAKYKAAYYSMLCTHYNFEKKHFSSAVRWVNVYFSLSDEDFNDYLAELN
tara:strand:+ start:195 stop:479 length:285 start_codon:yes stop_codon:yes gene_type:complete